MPVVATVGSIITDLLVYTPRVPARGENLLAHRFQIGPGGKGANAAVACARLGALAILVGCVGDDQFGSQELAALRAEGVVVDGVSVHSQESTGVAFILVDDSGENTILVVDGANSYLSAPQVQTALAPHWSRLDAVLVDFEVPPEAVAAAVRGAAQHGIPCIVDAGPPRPFPEEIWRDATILTPNELEAAALVRHPVESETQAEAAARALLAKGPQAVVIKRGGAGALLATGREIRHLPAFPVASVDTTGAGDAFSGALAVAVAEGFDLEGAVRFANAAGGLATTRWGTMRALPWRADVEALLRGQGQDNRL